MVFDLSGSSKQYLLVERNICETLARQAPDLTVSSCTDHKKYPQQPSIQTLDHESALISFSSVGHDLSRFASSHEILECFFYAFFNLKKSSFFMTTLHHTLSQIVACGCFWIRKKCIWRVFSVSFSI